MATPTQRFSGTVERVYRKPLPKRAHGANQKSTVEIRTRFGLLVEFAVYGPVLKSAPDKYGRGVLTLYGDPCKVGDLVTVDGRVNDACNNCVVLKNATLVECEAAA